jgi:hypothetical protein
VETTTYSETVGCIEEPVEQRIEKELRLKLFSAEEKKIEAFWSVDIQRNQADEPVPTVTIIADNTGTEEQREAVRQHLWGIAEVLREIYRAT